MSEVPVEPWAEPLPVGGYWESTSTDADGTYRSTGPNANDDIETTSRPYASPELVTRAAQIRLSDTRRAAAAPTGLAVTTYPYTDMQGVTQGRIAASWNAVSAARVVDGGGPMEIARYELAVRRNVAGAPWTEVRSTEALEAEHGPLTVGDSVQVMVRAIGRYTTAPGDWSDVVTLTVASDVTAPPVPSAPVVSTRLGVVQVEWNGLAAAGGSGIPADFARVEVAVGTTETPTTVRGTIMRAGGAAHVNGLPYSTSHWVRLRAVDLSGNMSDWSAAVSTSVPPLVDADLIGSTVDARLAATTSNLIPNGAVASGVVSPWSTLLTVDTADKPTNLRASLRTVAGQGNISTVNGANSWFAVTPAGKYHFEIWLKADLPNSNFYLELRDQAAAHAVSSTVAADDGGTSLAGHEPYLVKNLVVPTVWTRYSGIITLTSTASRVRLGVAFFNHANGTERNAVVSMAGVSLRPMSPAVLIEAGAITAPKLFADVAMANQLAAVFADFGTTRTNWLKATHVDAGTFRGYVIEGADIKSTTTGDALNYIRLNDRTLSVGRDDGEGGSAVTVELGGPTDDRLVLRTTTGQTQALFDAATGDGAVAGELSVGGLRVGGDSLADILEPYPKGILVQYWGSGDSLPAGGFGSTPYGIVKMRFPMVANRRYLFRASLAINGPSDQHADFALRSATDPSTVVADSTRIKTWRAPMVGANQSVELSHPLFATAAETREILLTLNSTGTGPIYAVPGSTDSSWMGQYWLEDLGYIDRSGTITATWTSGGGTPYSGSALSDATMAKTTTKEYAATWMRSWRGSDIVSDFLHHGYYGGYQRYSMVGFGGTLAADLSGATINKVEVLVDNESWWGSSGTIHVGSATDTSAPASPVTTGTTANTAMGEGVQKWVPVGGFSTSSRAITLGVGAGTGTSTYGKFRYTGVRLRVTYTK